MKEGKREGGRVVLCGVLWGDQLLIWLDLSLITLIFIVCVIIVLVRLDWMVKLGWPETSTPPLCLVVELKH